MPARSLRQGLDNEVYAIVDRLLQDQSQPTDVRSVYNAIQKSNSSVKRKPKKVLEDSIERVLDAMADEVPDEEARLEQQHETVTSEVDSNLMNRSITSGWNSKTKSKPITPIDGEANGTGEPPRKKRRAGPEEKDRSPPTDISWEDMGGVDHVITQLQRSVVLPLIRPNWFTQYHLSTTRGVLLHGPPGCGKSALSRATAAELGVPFIEILGPSIVSNMSGESEKRVRDIFDEAQRVAPCLIFVDEIDVIAPKREESSQSQMEKRIVAQFLVSMDNLSHDPSKPVIVLAATNRPDSIDPALRRGGRFDIEINMPVPDQATREKILRVQTRNTPLAQDVDFVELAKRTPGYVGADLKDLVSKAGTHTMEAWMSALIADANPRPRPEDGHMEVDPPVTLSEAVRTTRALIARGRNATDPNTISAQKGIDMAAFLAVLPDIVPSSKRQGFATTPDVSWEDIGALESVRTTLNKHVVDRIKDPHKLAKFGITQPTGVLLWGPPGCGKTLLAKATAAESKANFISVKGPELMEKYVGESERAVRTLFMRARSSVPCIIFFDELDALVPRRDAQNSEVASRVVNTFLAELDGLSDRDGIWVIGATNRPDTIDDALLRPGRLEKPLYVGLPGAEERVAILRALLRPKRKNAHTVVWPDGLDEFVRHGEACRRFSGADLGALKRLAVMNTVARDGEQPTLEDFQAAAREIRPSVHDMSQYEKCKQRFGSGL